MRIPHREGELCDRQLAAIPEVFPPGFKVLRHQDVRHPGYPDWSVSANGRSCWWEFKHGTPTFDDFKLQLQTCRELARASYCRYVIWQESDAGQNTLIVHPDEVLAARRRGSWAFHAEAAAPGFDFLFVARFMHRLHFGDLYA
jgi:hypothetical protein